MSNISSTNCNLCTKCTELVLSRTQIVHPTIAKTNGLLVIGEAPGRDEDKQGEGFVGTAGITLARLLSIHGVLPKSYAKANICRCRPLDNRKPTLTEIDNCLPYLAEFIRETKPRVILTVGATPTKVFCGAGNLSNKISRKENDYSADKCHTTAHKIIRPVLEFVDFIVPTPHTSPLAFNRNAPSGEKWSIVAARQIAIAISLLK